MGLEHSAFSIGRFLTDNVIISAGLGVLLPARGYREIYQTTTQSGARLTPRRAGHVDDFLYNGLLLSHLLIENGIPSADIEAYHSRAESAATGAMLAVLSMPLAEDKGFGPAISVPRDLPAIAHAPSAKLD